MKHISVYISTLVRVLRDYLLRIFFRVHTNLVKRCNISYPIFHITSGNVHFTEGDIKDWTVVGSLRLCATGTPENKRKWELYCRSINF
jgi:hypothetical protein